MHETRRRIVELLRVRDGLAVEELARALQVTRTAVTSHLSALQADGYVVRRGLRAGRRRPSVMYVLTPAADTLFPKAYDDLAASVLAELSRAGGGELPALLRKVSDRWIAQDLPKIERLRGAQRLRQAQQILADRGFLPVLERAGTGYVLREHNCPVMRLAYEHPEICDMVHRWMEALFGMRMERMKCMRRGDAFSEYRLAARSR